MLMVFLLQDQNLVVAVLYLGNRKAIESLVGERDLDRRRV